MAAYFNQKTKKWDANFTYSAFEIAKRVGHKSERITYYYAHMFPGVQENIAERLDEERKMD